MFSDVIIFTLVNTSLKNPALPGNQKRQTYDIPVVLTPSRGSNSMLYLKAQLNIKRRVPNISL